ncbi:hypothetical protein [Marinoscillum sp.]|uniref:hypothetical protein n=1 Tax=Marinoscillum sp. TaxID=2024838 RepID=UPI003BAB461A
MSNKELSGNESLQLITSMINQAKSNYQKGGSFYFLLWGWVIMLANFSHYYLDAFTDYAYPYIVWVITIPAAIVSGVYGSYLKRKAQVSSHLDRLYAHVWIAAGVGILIVLFYMSHLQFNHNAVIMLFSGMGTYVSGQILRFKPLVLGGMVLAITSIVCFNVSVTDQYLVGGIGIFAGYLIPGYLLKNKEK